MGLDMYLYRAPLVGDITANQIVVLDSYFDWLRSKAEGDKYANCSFEQWCGHSEDEIEEIGEDAISILKDAVHTRYYVWDTDKEYDALDCLNRVIENKTFWRSFCGNAPEELIGCYKWILLKDALLNAGSNAICDFIGCDSISVTDVDELKVMLEDAKAQMPEETLEAYYKKYVEEADL